ncbi:MAG: hypothetical protein ACJ8CR_03340 [Roseiflexaceae bacterium]
MQWIISEGGRQSFGHSDLVTHRYSFKAWHPFVLLSLITVLLVYGFARLALATPPAIDLILGRSGEGRAFTAVRIGDDPRR